MARNEMKWSQVLGPADTTKIFYAVCSGAGLRQKSTFRGNREFAASGVGYGPQHLSSPRGRRTTLGRSLAPAAARISYNEYSRSEKKF